MNPPCQYKKGQKHLVINAANAHLNMRAAIFITDSGEEVLLNATDILI